VADIRDAALAAWLGARGGVLQRPFTRMVLGAGLPGEAGGMAVLAGPEFG